MTPKVIYVSFMRLSERVARDGYIDFLMAKSVAVEYWDLVPLLFGGDASASKQTDYLRTPHSYQEFNSQLRLPENEGALFMMLISYEGRTTDVYRLLSQHGCRTYFIAWGELPINHGSRSLRILSRVVSNPTEFAQAFYCKIKAIAYRKLKLVKPYDVVFAAGRELLASKHYANKVVPINLVDYDHYVRVLSEKTPFSLFGNPDNRVLLPRYRHGLPHAAAGRKQRRSELRTDDADARRTLVFFLRKRSPGDKIARIR